ncbi:MAG: hypothetical protein KKD18_01460 [Nanoarchaeota archaeon]|nr:hypothetical protein [Nanoarchaeota archaeon]MBU0977060.1 hypothetical protein [Nanoarchaeota archaeon]
MRNRLRVRFDPDRIVNYLRSLDINVQYRPPNFSDGQEEFAMIELTTSRQLQEAMVNEINARLNRDNGYEAQLRIIDYGTEIDGRIHYAAEVVPFEDVTSAERKVLATQQFLHSLPRTVKNLRCKHNRRK